MECKRCYSDAELYSHRYKLTGSTLYVTRQLCRRCIDELNRADRDSEEFYNNFMGTFRSLGVISGRSSR